MCYKNCASRNQKSTMPGSIVSVKAIHKSLTSKHKTVRNVSVDNMYLFEYKYMHQEYEQI